MNNLRDLQIPKPTAICTPRRPCRRWRTCSTCARKRQAKIADAATLLFEQHGRLRWHILYPAQKGSDALRAARADWLRHANPSSAIWTVEQSRKTGALHCNLITPINTLHAPRTGHYWNQEIQGDPRAVAAYISKPSQFPNERAYTGKLYGITGHIWQLLMTQNQSPAVAAAAAQHAIASHHAIDRAAYLARSPSQQNRLKWAEEARAEQRQKTKQLEYYREIAAKWLPDLLSK